VSSAVEGWYVDPSTGTNLRYWNGSTWTDEVAPLPYMPTHSGPIDPSAVAAAAAREPELEHPVVTVLDPALEHTHLTRRELRARRQEPPVDDAPKHLPPMTVPSAISFSEWAAAEEPLQAPAPTVRSGRRAAQAVIDAPSAPITDVPRAPAAPVTAAPSLPVSAVSVVTAAPPELVSAPANAADDPADDTADDTAAEDPDTNELAAKRVRVVRMSVLLGILAVVSSIAVLTAGTL
jgi:hypothetical protein